jgi:rhamnogalacturonyl hydrolase YesR
LTLESFLFCDYYLKKDLCSKVVTDVYNKRKINPRDTIDYKSQPFCSINFTLGNLTGNKNWFTGYIHESYRMHKSAVKSSEGAIMINHQGKHIILIDYMQEYASRMAKTGYLTQDSMLFSECVNQFLIYEELLSNKSTGLWSQGRGWCSDSALVARGAWSRGHGWLLRGIVTSMLYLPEEQKSVLLPILERVSHSLFKIQARNGMYHILLNLPINESEPDVSGTGMIAFYMSIAIQNGWLNEDLFKPCTLKATKAIKKFVTENGEITCSSKGPGPLCLQEEYRNYKPEIDEKHGFQGVIYGMLAEIIVNE